MAKKGGDAPAPPDPVATANAQAAANAETARLQARLNRVNQVTPFGTLTYSNDPRSEQFINDFIAQRRAEFEANPKPATERQIVGYQQGSEQTQGAPIYGDVPVSGGGVFDEAAARKAAMEADPYRDLATATTALSPEQKKIFDEQQQLSLALSQLANSYTGRINDATSKPFDLSALGEAPQADDAARQRIESALFDRINPQLERDRAALEQRLANQGIQVGSEAYNKAIDDYNRGVNDLRLGVVQQGGAEQARQFGLETTRRQNLINELLMQRNQPINEVAALLGTGPGVQMPQFANVPQTSVQPTDVTGPIYANYQGQMNAYNQRVGQENALMGGLFSLGAAGLGGWARAGFPSDRRIKENIRKVGRLESGLPVYVFNFKGDPIPQMGVMAQEVEQVIPAAVINGADGIKRVRYEMLG